MKSAITSYSLASLDSQVSALVPTSGVWVDELGGIVCLADTGSTFVAELCLVKPDGKYIRFGRRGVSFTAVGYAYDGYVAARWSSAIAQRIVLPPTQLVGTARSSATDGSFAMLSDRIIQFDGKIVTYVTFAGASGTAATINAGGGSAGCLAPYDLEAGRSLWWLIDKTNGTIYLYNALTAAEVTGYRSSFGGAVVFATYSRKHAIWGVVMVSLPTTLKLFTNEPGAAAVSTPTFSGTTYTREKVTLSATVTGSDGEPCPGRVVVFAVGTGTLPLPNVETDADGVAETEYQGPTAYAEDAAVSATLVE